MTRGTGQKPGEFGTAFSGGWEDQQGNVAAATKPLVSPTVEQYGNTGVLLTFLRHDRDDELHPQFQFSHSYNAAGVLYLHVHLIPMATWVPAPASKDVYWEIRYFCAGIGDAVPIALVGGWTTTNVATPLTPAEQYFHVKKPLITITPPATFRESGIIIGRVRRLGTNLLDTYDDNKDHETGAANLCALYVDPHYLRTKEGSATQ